MTTTQTTMRAFDENYYVGKRVVITGGTKGFGAVNPLYALDAVPFSDAFLLVVLALALVSAGMLSRRSTEKPKG